MSIRILLLSLLCLSSYQVLSQKVKLTPYASSLGYPIDVRHCNDDRLFVADRTGLIRIVNPDQSVRSVPFLDVRNRVSSTNGEEGFLAFCFSPGYKTNGKFYVFYTTKINNKLHSMLEQYKVSSTDSNLADPASALTIGILEQPFGNHKGGHLVFGKDGYLYIPLGDGGSSGDPLNNSQNNDRLLGKILRINVANSTSTQPYTIPPDNPFVNTGGNIRKEIWANGLRNPWRVSFDRLTYDLWIADVGEGRREEINFQPFGSKGGENYGWKIMEGTRCFSPSSGCNPSGLVTPIHDYDHQEGRSVIGGNVYRSVQSRELWEMYIYSDYRGRWIDGIRQNNGIISGQIIRLMDKVNGAPISFGEDRFGELYICLNRDEKIYKVEDANINPFPKAHLVPTQTGNGYLLNAVEGRNITYQWLFNNAPISGANSPVFAASQNGEYKLVVSNQPDNKDTSAAFLIGAALPVTLIDFVAKNIRADVIEISWNTVTEQNNKGFSVERKLQHEPVFQSLTFIPSKAINGNSATAIHYAINDTIISAGTIQYRLRQTDFDGKFAYSPVVTVNAGNSKLNVTVTPNPSRGWLRISANRYDQYEYQLNDFTGKHVLKSVFKGTNHQLSVHSLRSGVYYLKVQSNKGKDVLVLRVYIDNN